MGIVLGGRGGSAPGQLVFKIALGLFGVDPGTSPCGFPVLDAVLRPAEVLSAVAPTVEFIVGVFAFLRVAYKDRDQGCAHLP